MAIQLVVSSGPEAGRRVRCAGAVTTVGRGPKNDFVLQDGLVSQYHGEFLKRDWGYVYRDLRSRHGTLVKVNHVTVNLHDRNRPQEVTLVDKAELMLGESLITIEMTDDSSASFVSGLPASVLPDTLPTEGFRPKLDETIITRTQDSVANIAKRLSRQDPRLDSIFRLSRNLNATSDLDEILTLLGNAAFEAFKVANFFAISLLPEGAAPEDVSAMVTLTARERDESNPAPGQPVLSSSLLSQVATSRESVLFVRDESNHRITESIINAQIMACIAAPLVGQHSLIGVIQADTRGLGGLFDPEDLDLFTVMASYAAFAIERVRLSKSIVEMFEGIVRASVTAIDARDPTTAGHSERVAQLTLSLARAASEADFGTHANVTFSDEELVELRYAALLHDFGKIGVRESVLTKAHRLYPNEEREVLARFENIKANRALDIHRRAMQTLIGNPSSDAKQVHAQVEAAVQALAADLDEMRDYLMSNQVQRRISQDVIKEVQRIGALEYRDFGGVSRPYLLPTEIESLCIPIGTLNEADWNDMKAHSARSQEYLSQIPWSEQLKNIPCIAGWHHEKLNGSGYPNGLEAEEIPAQVRILTICDIFDALTAADRPYRKAVPQEKANQILFDEANRGLLDKDLVDLFIRSVLPLQLPFIQSSSHHSH